MKDLYQILDQLNIVYKKYEHPAVYTCEEADKFCPKRGEARSKNLFLRNKKGTNHYLVILESRKEVNLRQLEQELQDKKISFASPERLAKYLGLTSGSVSPFGLINDENKEVKVVVDEDLKNYQTLSFHPNINTASLEITREDFIKFLNWCGNEVRWLKF